MKCVWRGNYLILIFKPVNNDDFWNTYPSDNCPTSNNWDDNMKAPGVYMKISILSLFVRFENTIKYHSKLWLVPEPSAIFGFKFSQTLDVMLPRLLSRLGSKYFSQSLWWKAAHCYYHKEKPVLVWRIHQHCLGWEHRVI